MSSYTYNKVYDAKNKSGEREEGQLMNMHVRDECLVRYLETLKTGRKTWWTWKYGWLPQRCSARETMSQTEVGVVSEMAQWIEAHTSALSLAHGKQVGENRLHQVVPSPPRLCCSMHGLPTLNMHTHMVSY